MDYCRFCGDSSRLHAMPDTLGNSEVMCTNCGFHTQTKTVKKVTVTKTTEFWITVDAQGLGYAKWDSKPKRDENELCGWSNGEVGQSFSLAKAVCFIPDVTKLCKSMDSMKVNIKLEVKCDGRNS